MKFGMFSRLKIIGNRGLKTYKKQVLTEEEKIKTNKKRQQEKERYWSEYEVDGNVSVSLSNVIETKPTDDFLTGKEMESDS